MASALCVDRSGAAVLSASSCAAGEISAAEAAVLPMAAGCLPFTATEGSESSKTCCTELEALEPLSCPFRGAAADDVLAMRSV